MILHQQQETTSLKDQINEIIEQSNCFERVGSRLQNTSANAIELRNECRELERSCKEQENQIKQLNKSKKPLLKELQCIENDIHKFPGPFMEKLHNVLRAANVKRGLFFCGSLPGKFTMQITIHMITV